MSFKSYIKPAIGIAAFVIGGLLARGKAEEAVDSLSKAFAMSNDSSD